MSTFHSSIDERDLHISQLLPYVSDLSSDPSVHSSKPTIVSLVVCLSFRSDPLFCVLTVENFQTNVTHVVRVFGNTSATVFLLIPLLYRSRISLLRTLDVHVPRQQLRVVGLTVRCHISALPSDKHRLALLLGRAHNFAGEPMSEFLPFFSYTH